MNFNWVVFVCTQNTLGNKKPRLQTCNYVSGAICQTQLRLKNKKVETLANTNTYLECLLAAGGVMTMKKYKSNMSGS